MVGDPESAKPRAAEHAVNTYDVALAAVDDPFDGTQPHLHEGVMIERATVDRAQLVLPRLSCSRTAVWRYMI